VEATEVIARRPVGDHCIPDPARRSKGSESNPEEDSGYKSPDTYEYHEDKWPTRAIKEDTNN
jgi:hypothetical protein